MLAVWAVAAIALDRWIGDRVTADAKPWLGVAAGLFFSLSIATVWGMLFGRSPRRRLARGHPRADRRGTPS